MAALPPMKAVLNVYKVQFVVVMLSDDSFETDMRM